MKILLVLFLLSFSDNRDYKVEWLPNQETDLAGYKLYFGEIFGKFSDTLNVGHVTSYFFTWPYDKDLVVVGTAYDSSGNESSFSLPDSIIFGDVNDDGKVDIFDRMQVRMLQGVSLGDSLYNIRADVNNDGKIDIFDRMKIRLMQGRR